MSLSAFSTEILSKWSFEEFRHAVTILRYDFPNEFEDLNSLLKSFTLKRSAVEQPGGGKTKISGFMDDFLYKRGWSEHHFDTKTIIDSVEYDTPTHKIDCFKNRIALDIEWNNKTEFYDRDLNNFRLLHERNAISVGIIITRTESLDPIFKRLGIYSKYGASTTIMSKLIPRLKGGSGGGCPILVIGITDNLYDPNN